MTKMSSLLTLDSLALVQNRLLQQTVVENYCVINIVLDIVEDTEEDSI